MEIRKAMPEELDQVEAFYHAQIELILTFEYDAKWRKDVYPTRDFMEDSIEAGEMFIGLEDDKIIAAMVVNHGYNEGYKKAKWQVEAKDDEIMVIHILAVLLSLGKKGLGKEMVQYAIDYARANDQKVMRLDVLKGNVPAERLYPKMGFKFIEEQVLYYEDTDWMAFELYELVL